MTKKLVKHGNSWALVIDKPILDLLKIDADTPLELSTDGQTLNISPVNRAAVKDRVRNASKKVNSQYNKAFKKLAE